MRIAAISDVHGNVFALRAVLADIESAGADLIVNLGDHLSGAVAPAETADLLMETPAVTIRGNHERQILDDPPSQMGASDRLAHDTITGRHRQWLAELPASAEPTDGVFAFHGTPDSDLVYLLETITSTGVRPATADETRHRLVGHLHHDLLLCGHSHLQRYHRVEGGPLVVNPGSVGWPAYRDDEPIPHNIEAGSPHARYALLDNASGRWEVENRAIIYPWSSAAALATVNGRPDVAHALLTGTMST